MNLVEEEEHDGELWEVDKEDLQEENEAQEWLTVGPADANQLIHPKYCILYKRKINNLSKYSDINMGAISLVPSQSLRVGTILEKLDHAFKIDVISGATVSFFREDVVNWLNLNVLPNNQLAILADKISQLKSLGEVDVLV